MSTQDINLGCGDGVDKGGVGPRTNHLTSRKVDFCIYGGDFVSYQSREHSYTSHEYKYSRYRD